MSSISLSKPQRMTAAAPRRTTEGKTADLVRAVSRDDQHRPAAANETFSPALFWEIIMALAMVLFINAAIGISLHGTDWLTAYWNAWDYWCAGAYCS